MENTYLKDIKMRHSENNKLLKQLEVSKKEFEEIKPQLENFQSKLSLEIMVPIPENKTPLAFIKGTVVHTNEILVKLGDEYYTEMSVTDTINYCNRKSNDITQKQNQIRNEQKLLLERISFLESYKQSDELEIVEEFNEEDDKLWRQQHALSIKKMKEKEAVERKKINEESPDDYFKRLEELEQMELEDS